MSHAPALAAHREIDVAETVSTSGKPCEAKATHGKEEPLAIGSPAEHSTQPGATIDRADAGKTRPSSSLSRPSQPGSQV